MEIMLPHLNSGRTGARPHVVAFKILSFWFGFEPGDILHDVFVVVDKRVKSGEYRTDGPRASAPTAWALQSTS